MKRKLLKGAVAITFSFLALVSCDKQGLTNQTETIPVEMIALNGNSTGTTFLAVNSSTGATTFNVTGLSCTFSVTADLTANEIEFLYAVREDEKVARDLYTSFYKKYALTPFANIGAAESNHIKAVERLFDYYQIKYPEVGPAGVFANTTRQDLYNSLLSQGNISALEAFKVMAKDEETGIVNYKEVIKTIVNPNIKMVLENLTKASENHLKAAIRQITALGGVYTPVLMSVSEFDTIIASGFQQGGKYMNKNSGQTTNCGSSINQKNNAIKGSVNSSGVCELCSNGSVPGTQCGTGTQGGGYRRGC